MDMTCEQRPKFRENKNKKRRFYIDSERDGWNNGESGFGEIDLHSEYWGQEDQRKAVNNPC